MIDAFMAEALVEARTGLDEGGMPVGSVVVKDDAILGRGRNSLFQTGDPTGHAEMEAYRDAARNLAATAAPYQIDKLLRGSTVYTTLMPCPMCAGAIIWFGAARVVVGDAKTYGPGTQALMESRGIAVRVLDAPVCVELMQSYLRRIRREVAARRGGGNPCSASDV